MLVMLSFVIRLLSSGRKVWVGCGRREESAVGWWHLGLGQCQKNF